MITLCPHCNSPLIHVSHHYECNNHPVQVIFFQDYNSNYSQYYIIERPNEDIHYEFSSTKNHWNLLKVFNNKPNKTIVLMEYNSSIKPEDAIPYLNKILKMQAFI